MGGGSSKTRQPKAGAAAATAAPAAAKEAVAGNSGARGAGDEPPEPSHGMPGADAAPEVAALMDRMAAALQSKTLTRATSSLGEKVTFMEKQVGGPPMLLLPLGKLRALKRIPHSSEGLAIQALDVVREGGGADTDDLIFVFFSHRWCRPSLDPAQAHPDSAEHVKASKLVQLGDYLQRLGFQEGKIFFWIDFCCVDQKDPMMGIAKLPVYITCCTCIVIFDFADYELRAWCRTERLLAFVFSQAVGSQLAMDAHSTFDGKLISELRALSDPLTGVLTNTADLPAIQMLRDRALNAPLSGWQRAILGEVEFGSTVVTVKKFCGVPMPARFKQFNFTEPELKIERVTDEEMPYITYRLSTDMYIRKLDLSSCAVTDPALFLQLREAQCLEILSLPFGLRSPQVCAALAKGLPRTLRVLSVNNCYDVDCKSWKPLLDALGAHPAIEGLHIGGHNRLENDTGAGLVAAGLGAHPTLRSFSWFNNTDCSHEGITVLGAWLGSLPRLEECNFRASGLRGDLAAQRLGEGLRASTTVKRVLVDSQYAGFLQEALAGSGGRTACTVEISPDRDRDTTVMCEY